MRTAVLIVALASWGLVAVAGLADIPVLGWLGIAASVVGLVLLLVAGKRRNEIPDDSPEDDGVLHADVHHPDYAPSGHPAHDAPTHDDHEIDRAVQREEHVVHPDSGPRDQDISSIRATETISGTHFRADHDRGRRTH